MSYTVKPLDEEDAARVDKAFRTTNALVEYNPGRCLLPPYHINIAQQILDATVRKDDVWLLSYPRTGSTWCQEMLWLIGNDLDFQTARNTIQQIRAPLIEMSTILVEFQKSLGALVDDSVNFVEKMASPRFIKSHLPYQLLPTQMDKVKPKIIYTCRNPKDMCVSFYFHCKMVHNLDAPFEEFCDLLIKGLMPIGDVFQHYLSFWNMRHESNVLFLRFEDMKHDLRGTLKKIAKFLNKSYTEEQYDSLCDFLSFEKMRENRGCNLEFLINGRNGEQYNKKSDDHFIRKGQIGDYKNHMSPEMIERFDQWIEENTKGTGLSFDNNY